MKKKHLIIGGAILVVVLAAIFWKILWGVLLAVALAAGYIAHSYRKGGGG